MRIAYFTDTYLPQLNGVSISIRNTVSRLNRQGHTVHIFAPEISGYKDEEKNIIRLKSFKVLSSEPEVMFPLILPNKNYRKILSLPFDLIHAHGNGAFSLLGYQASRMRRLPYILTFHNLHTKYTHYILKGKIITPKMVATALRVFGNVSDGIITPSIKMKKELLSYGLKKHIEIIPGFIEFEEFQGNPKGFIHKQLGIDSSFPIILSVGRLAKEKNFAFLIRVFSGIHKLDPLAHFVLVGQGPEKKSLAALVSRLGLSDFFHFMNQVRYKDLPKVYAGADIFLFASKTETQGVVISEAVASGLPLVVVDDDAFKNLVTSKNGFVVPLSKKDFIEKTIYLLKNQKIREKMGQHSRENARNNCSPEEIINRLVNYYDHVITAFNDKRQTKRIFPKYSLKILSKVSSAVENFFK